MLRFTTILITLTIGFVSVQAVSVEELRNLNIPVMVVKTVNDELPTCDFVEAPAGCDGVTTSNQTKVHASMLIVLGNDTLYNSGEYKKDTSGLTIKIRGNTSGFYRPMKPYKLKLQKKADLLTRGDSTYFDKNWVLMNYYYYNPVVANKVLDLLDFGWHPECKYVNFFLNDDFQGLYILSESIKRNVNCRVNISKDGFLFENDPYWWNDSIVADAEAIPNKYKFTFKYPDSDKVTKAQVDSLSLIMNRVEESILAGTYKDRIDVESFVKWILLHDIIGTFDSGGSNMFLTVNDCKSKVKMATPWDFDSAFNLENKGSLSRIHDDRIFYYPYLFTNSNPYFVEQYHKIWTAYKDKIFTEIMDFLTSLKNSPTAKDITLSRRYMVEKWYDPVEDEDRYSSYNVDDEIENLKTWFSERKDWLNENVESIKKSVSELTSSPPQE